MLEAYDCFKKETVLTNDRKVAILLTYKLGLLKTPVYLNYIFMTASLLVLYFASTGSLRKVHLNGHISKTHI